MKRSPTRLFSIRFLPLFALIVAISGAMPPLIAATNLLVNPGFESDVTGTFQNLGGWIANANTFAQTGSPAHAGNNYLKVYGQFQTNANYSGAYQDVPAVAGATFQASGWAYSAA